MGVMRFWVYVTNVPSLSYQEPWLQLQWQAMTINLPPKCHFYGQLGHVEHLKHGIRITRGHCRCNISVKQVHCTP